MLADAQNFENAQDEGGGQPSEHGAGIQRGLDVEDAKATLKFVAVKEATRASKRKAEAQLAADAEKARKMLAGARCAAKRAAIALRPVKTKRVVENTGRVRWS